MSDDWLNINFEILRHIGFSETRLRQLHDSRMSTPEIVQDAINRFAYSLEHNAKAKAYNDPLNVLMGVLRKGQRWIEPNYISAKELALRELLEEKRKKQQEHEVMIKELIDLEFPEWRKSLTQEQIKEILPPDVLRSNIAPAVHASLRMYFVETVLKPRLALEGIEV